MQREARSVNLRLKTPSLVFSMIFSQIWLVRLFRRDAAHWMKRDVVIFSIQSRDVRAGLWPRVRNTMRQICTNDGDIGFVGLLELRYPIE